MPRFLLLLVVVIAAAGLTVWVGSILASSSDLPAAGGSLALVVLLIGYGIWRIISARR